jgi:hypothetical protein
MARIAIQVPSSISIIVVDVILTNRAPVNHRSIELTNLNRQWESRGFGVPSYTRESRRLKASGMVRDRLTS